MNDKMREPLEGIRIIDFSRQVTGPLITTYLANYGAEVIKVESVKSPDVSRVSAPFKNDKPGLDRSGTFIGLNNSKLSIGLDLTKSKGRDIVRRLVLLSDIVINTFRVGLLESWGLGYEKLREIKSDIIMMSISIQGQTGPGAQFKGYGYNTVGLTGLADLTGWPDRAPAGIPMAYPDTITPWFGVIAIFLALRHRQQTGRGQYIDLSQYETTLHFLAPEVLDFFVNGRVVTRQGNRVSDSAPHGAYQCLGGDEWCTIAVSSDGEWHSFCCAIGNPQWTKDPKFVSLPTRKQNEDELDHLVNEWTIRFSSEEVMSKMQAHGVPAGVARTAKGIFEDPQLKHRNHFVVLQHPEVGYCSNPSWPAKLSKAPPQIRHAPCIGNDNTYVYSKLLGISNEEIGNLIADGVVEFL